MRWPPDRSRWWSLGLAAALTAAACRGPGGGPSDARSRYNEALAQLEAKRWEGAKDGLLKARDAAGQDPELRFRAAFNLALAYAGLAEGTEKAKPEEALEHLRHGAGWFRDAVRATTSRSCCAACSSWPTRSTRARTASRRGSSG
jgi:hypothetical protein